MVAAHSSDENKYKDDTAQWWADIGAKMLLHYTPYVHLIWSSSWPLLPSKNAPPSSADLSESARMLQGTRK